MHIDYLSFFSETRRKMNGWKRIKKTTRVKDTPNLIILDQWAKKMRKKQKEIRHCQYFQLEVKNCAKLNEWRKRIKNKIEIVLDQSAMPTQVSNRAKPKKWENHRKKLDIVHILNFKSRILPN